MKLFIISKIIMSIIKTDINVFTLDHPRMTSKVVVKVIRMVHGVSGSYRDPPPTGHAVMGTIFVLIDS